MSTSGEFHDYIVENLGEGITTRKMMGEYCVYYQGKLVGDLCDNCLFLKKTETSVRLLKGAEEGYPYEGSKTLMLMVENVENRALMTQVLQGMYTELPEPKKKKKKQKIDE